MDGSQEQQRLAAELEKAELDRQQLQRLTQQVGPPWCDKILCPVGVCNCMCVQTQQQAQAAQLQAQQDAQQQVGRPTSAEGGRGRDGGGRDGGRDRGTD